MYLTISFYSFQSANRNSHLLPYIQLYKSRVRSVFNVGALNINYYGYCLIHSKIVNISYIPPFIVYTI